MSTVLSTTATNIIDDTFMLIAPGENIKPKEKADLLRMLNIMVKGWQSQGYLWKISDVTVTLTPGTVSYLVGPGGEAGTLLRVRPLQLKYAVRTQGTTDIPVEVISRQEYKELPYKTQQGPVVSICYDPQLTNGVLYVWYTGDTSNTTLVCTFADPVDLLDNNEDTPDFPDEWIEPIVYNLAVRSAPMFGRPAPQEVKSIAASSLGAMIQFDSEPVSISFRPGGR
jgi:hypothetical protein